MFSPHYERPKRYFLKNGLIRRMFDVTQLKPMTSSAMSTASVRSHGKGGKIHSWDDEEEY